MEKKYKSFEDIYQEHCAKKENACLGCPMKDMANWNESCEEAYGRLSKEEMGFENWWSNLQKSESIAAWMIKADLPKGIAKQIFDDAQNVRNPEVDELQKKLDEASTTLKEYLKATGENCRPDHRGYCQEHWLHDADKCPAKLAKEFLLNLEGK